MLFRIDGEGAVVSVPASELADLGFREREDLQEWVIKEPEILGEELLIVTSEYAGFEDTLNRLDVLALDRIGNLVVIELKRDRADRTTDLQALKYASFCSTLTAEDVQQLYRKFHSRREDTDISPEEVGNRLADFLHGEEPVSRADSGFVEFELSDRPRIILAAGDFGTEITSPVLWLRQEFGLDISCIRISAYERDGEYFVQGQRIIPVPEAEEYMTKRRKKEESKQEGRRRFTFDVLIERGILQTGDELLFNKRLFAKDWMPDSIQERWDPEDDFWRAVVTGKTGQSNNVRWCYNDDIYSFTGLTRAVLRDIYDEDDPYFSDAFEYWVHPEFDDKSLRTLREQGIASESSRH